MTSKQEQRSEETKKMILQAAGKLFAKKGYDSVTIREIAKEALCSHTTIYLYFKDKEALLYQLSLPSLLELQQELQHITHLETLSVEGKLKEMGRKYIHFCLKNRNMYTIFMNAKSSRVDEDKPELAINQLRNNIFEMLMQLIQEYLQTANEEQILAYSRVFYYNLNGILHTYSYQHEPDEVLMERLAPTFDLAVEVLLLGFKKKIKI